MTKKQKGGSMNGKLKSVALGSLVASSLMLAAVPAMARDWNWFDRHHRWDHARDWRWDHARERYGRQYGSPYYSDQLQQAEQQAQYDASHHASRKKIAQDNAVIDSILNGMGYQR
jgi:hypothetical protein